MDATTAGRLTRTLDSLHSTVYFVPEANEKFGQLCMDPRMHYFASRAAPMGAASAKVVAATFYNFNPELVARAIPAAWELASPATITRVRCDVVDAALPRVLGDELANSAELQRGSAILRRVAEAIPNADGRPLYAGHAELDWPEAPYAQLWHAITLLREHRGDGHIAALITHGLSGLEALISHSATGMGFNAEPGRKLRGWSREEWDAAAAGLRDRGLLDDDGSLTTAGDQLRSGIEDLTDDLGYAPWRIVPDDQADELAGLAKVVRAAVMDAAVFPPGVFGPRYGQHR